MSSRKLYVTIQDSHDGDVQASFSMSWISADGFLKDKYAALGARRFPSRQAALDEGQRIASIEGAEVELRPQ